MSDLYAAKSGKFLGLNETQLAQLNPEQRAAYDTLAAEHADLDRMNVLAEEAVQANRDAVTRLRAGEAEEARKPKWTFLDELRASQRQWRLDH